jgi:bifunctional non-homologous end joining protein LigD
MHGRWVLVRMKGKGGKQEPWLLIKENDEYARPADEFSVVDEMPDSVKALPMPAPRSRRCLRNRAPVEGRQPNAQRPSAVAGALSPQLATLVDAPPAGRRLAVRSQVRRLPAAGAHRRQRHPPHHPQRQRLDAQLQPLRDELATLKLPSGWYDGEIVVHDEEGRPDFGLLQNAFDEDHPATSSTSVRYAIPQRPRPARSPLEQRRAILETVLAKRQTDNASAPRSLRRRTT